ncbi:MAG: molecular chaperone TorD family protein [Nitrospirae bacterium]|nr:molecular chaperone TorD family protein [Nitrospirota bacterium]
MLGKIFWAEVYSQLSEFFKEPTEGFANDVASGRLLKFFKEIFSNLDNDASLIAGLSMRGDVYAILKEEYKRLFLGPMPPYIVPVESVYKQWSNDPECKLPISGEKGYMMGDPAIDMIKRYQAHGIVIPDKYSSMPDHIALELEYMSFLCRNADIKNQREFVSSRLNWADELTRDIRNLSGNTFYSLCAKITAFIISRSKVELSS